LLAAQQSRELSGDERALRLIERVGRVDEPLAGDDSILMIAERRLNACGDFGSPRFSLAGDRADGFERVTSLFCSPAHPMKVGIIRLFVEVPDCLAASTPRFVAEIQGELAGATRSDVWRRLGVAGGSNEAVEQGHVPFGSHERQQRLAFARSPAGEPAEERFRARPLLVR
jgi:hypothetical protein